jgi:hypothetical protein
MNKTIKKLDNDDFEVVTEMEECIVCGVETNEPKDKCIDFRYNYLEGAGQLCSKCAEKYE